MKESIYRNNKEKLKKYYKEILQKLEKYEDNIDASHKASYTHCKGQSILQIEKNNKNWRMNSQYEDETALDIWGKQFEKIPFNSVIQFFGMASISYVEELLSITPKEVYIILYEPSINVFLRMMKEKEISFLESERVGLVVKGFNEDQFKILQGICVGLANLPHIKYVCHPNYIEVFGHEYKEYMEIIKDHVERSVFNRNTEIVFNKEMPKNYVGNVKTFYHQYSVGQLCKAIPKDIPVIIISAGPSLNKNIKDLKEARNKAFLIATDTALKPLLRENIVPHCFITVDPGKPMILFEEERVFDIPMILTDSGNTDVVKRHRGKKFFSYDGNGYIEYFYEKGKKVPTPLSTGGSVANNAFSVGIEAGAKTIILVGQDLAFTGNRSHADGTFKEKMDEVDFTKRRMVEVESIDGDMVLTSLDFKHYLDWFENEIKDCKGVNVIDATEGGAKIGGTQIMTLKEAIELECKKEVNLDEVIEKIPRLFNKKQIKEFDEYTKESLIRLNNMQKKTQLGIKYYEKIVPYFHNNNLTGEEFKKLYKKIKKIDRDLEKEPLINVIRPYMKETEYKLLYDIGMVQEDIKEEGKTISDKGIAIFKMMQEAIEYVRPFIEEMVHEQWNERKIRVIVNFGKSQYGVLNLFTEEIAKGFEEKGCEVIRVDIWKENYLDILSYALAKPYDFIFDINGILMEDDTIYHYFKQKYVAYLVDHPMRQHKRLGREYPSYLATAVDKNHVNYLEKYYPNLKTVGYCPHGGMKGIKVEEYENRTIDVLVLGSYKNPKMNMSSMEKVTSGLKELIIDTCKQLELESKLTMEQALKNQLELRKIEMSDSEFAEIMANLCFIDEYIRGYYRDKVINTLSEHNIPVEIYGNGWKDFKVDQSDCIHIHESVSYEESLELMGKSKIVLNIMPWFKNGSHERVFTAMLNGALCITDKSQYLEETFTDGKDLVFYDLNAIEKLPEKIQGYLQDSKMAKEIAFNGKSNAEMNHTWKKRGHELINWIMGE